MIFELGFTLLGRVVDSELWICSQCKCLGFCCEGLLWVYEVALVFFRCF